MHFFQLLYVHKNVTCYTNRRKKKTKKKHDKKKENLLLSAVANTQCRIKRVWVFNQLIGFVIATNSISFSYLFVRCVCFSLVLFIFAKCGCIHKFFLTGMRLKRLCWSYNSQFYESQGTQKNDKKTHKHKSHHSKRNHCGRTH